MSMSLAQKARANRNVALTTIKQHRQANVRSLAQARQIRQLRRLADMVFTSRRAC